MLTMPEHTVSWVHVQGGVYGEMACPGGDIPCRLSHPSGNEGCRVPEGARAGDECSCGATLAGGHPCNLLAWMEDPSVAELCAEPDGTPLRDGSVEFQWEGDHYTWSYAKADSRPAGGAS